MRIVRVETALHSGAIDVRVDDRLEVARLSKVQRSKSTAPTPNRLPVESLGVSNDDGPVGGSHGSQVSVWTTSLMESGRG